MSEQKLTRKQLVALGEIATYAGGSKLYSISPFEVGSIVVRHHNAETVVRYAINIDGQITELP